MRVTRHETGFLQGLWRSYIGCKCFPIGFLDPLLLGLTFRSDVSRIRSILGRSVDWRWSDLPAEMGRPLFLAALVLPWDLGCVEFATPGYFSLQPADDV